jgi:hypothetical protein
MSETKLYSVTVYYTFGSREKSELLLMAESDDHAIEMAKNRFNKKYYYDVDAYIRKEWGIGTIVSIDDFLQW